MTAPLSLLLSRKPLGGAAAALLFSVTMSSTLVSASSPAKTFKAGCGNCAVIEAVLTPDGHVESARVVRSAGVDFDRKAFDSVKKRRYRVPKNNRDRLFLTITVWPHEIQ